MAKAKRKATKAPQEAKIVKPAETRTSRIEEASSSNDRGLLSRVVIVALVLLGLYLLFNLFSGRGDQQSGDKANDEEKTSQVENKKDTGDTGKNSAGNKAKDSQSANGTTVSETDTAYNFVAGEGESYTTIARSAIARADSSLTPAERVAAETKLTTDANAQLLEIGQSVTLDKAAVRAAVEYAKGMSAEEEAAWQPYADLVAW